MAGLPEDWFVYNKNSPILKGCALYNRLAIPLNSFNTMAAAGLFCNNNLQTQLPTMQQPLGDKNIMPAYVLQQLKTAQLPEFAGINDENALNWITTTRNQLDQIGVEKKFWVGEASVWFTHDAACWAKKWHMDHPQSHDWDLFLREFLESFEREENDLQTSHLLKELTQKGTVKEYTRAFEDIRSCAPPTINFNHLSTRLAYYNNLKPKVIRYMALEKCTCLEELYCKAESAEAKSNTVFQTIMKAKENIRAKPNHNKGKNKQPHEGENQGGCGSAPNQGGKAKFVPCSLGG